MTDSSILHNFPQWEKTKKNLEDEPYDDNLWNELVQHHEKLIADHKELLKSRTELKNLLYSDMDQLLTKFPYYTIYWKRYVTMVYTLEGLKPSIRVLERAVVSFPYSLDVWVDYINILLENKIKSDDEMGEIFVRASNKVGYHFLGHQFWDLYLGWAKSVYGSHSNDYIAILIRIIKLPLHQYAKYNQEFMQLSRLFTITDLIKKDDLTAYAKKVGSFEDAGEKLEDYIEAHSEQLVNSYFNAILVDVESRAHEKWKFESLVKSDFDLTMVTQEELNQWTNYLENEENYHRDRKTINNNNEIIALYERAIIPTCLSDKIWILYARYLIQNNGDHDRISQLFTRACDHFVPLDLKNIRYMYAKFIELKSRDFEKCKKIYLSLIGKSLTETEPISKYIDFLLLQETDDEKKSGLLQDIINCVFKFNQEQKSSEHVNKKKKASRSSKNNVLNQQSFDIKSSDIRSLYEKLTFWNVGQLIVNVCKYYWLTKKNIKLTRDTLMCFFGTPAVKSSKVYWVFFFKFELCQKNKKNLATLIEEVKTASNLNISDINFLIDQYNSFVFKNFTVTELKQNQRDIIKNILETDFESSMHMKHFLKIRLAEDHDEETINRRLVKENGHPAATCEGRPTLTNPLPVTQSSFATLTAHPLPRFRNVEKASLNVKYIHESL